MKIAVNKELLLKHRFWLMLALVFPFTGGAFFFLMTSVPAEIALNKKKLEEKALAIKVAAGKAGDAKTKEEIQKVKDKADELTKMQNGVHKEAFLAQEPLYTWPEEIENLFEFTYAPKSKERPEPRGLFAEVVRINSDNKGQTDVPDKNIVHGIISEPPAVDYFRITDAAGNKYKFFDTANRNIFRAGAADKKLKLKDLEKGNAVSVFYQKGKYFGDPLTQNEMREYRRVYKDQIYSILALVQPIDSRGQGRVRLGRDQFAWDYSPGVEPLISGNLGPFFNYLVKEIPPNKDYSEDVWIAQENLWIQREIYTLVKEANDSVAKFKLDRRYVCDNPSWKITLDVTGKNTLRAEIDNLLPSDQKFNHDLIVTTAKAKNPLVIKLPKLATFKAHAVQKDISLTTTANLFEDDILAVAVKDASVGEFHVNKSYFCGNPYWKITLKADKDQGDKIEATFENLLPRGQRFDFDLKLTISKASNAEPLVLKAPRDIAPFNPKGTGKTKGSTVDDGDVRTVALTATLDGKKTEADLRKTEILAVEQDLNWETAAVRRIDAVYLSALASGVISESSREFGSPRPLRAYVAPHAKSAAAAVAADPKAPPAKGVAAPVPGLGGEKNGIFGNKETTTADINQVRERYLQELDLTNFKPGDLKPLPPSPQLRRMPVAVVLTVEQSQVDRVQAAFNNSRLRFLTEQVNVTHINGSLRPKVAAAVADKDKGGKFAPPNPLPGPKTTSPASGGNELETNVELVIYGSITIYERYPPKLPQPPELAK